MNAVSQHLMCKDQSTHVNLLALVGYIDTALRSARCLYSVQFYMGDPLIMWDPGRWAERNNMNHKPYKQIV